MKIRNILFLLLSISLTACGAAKPSSSSHAQAHSDHKPTLDVKLEVSGNQVTVKLTTDMLIAPDKLGAARKEGEGHIHMYLDDGEKIAVASEVQVFKDLSPGPHTLRVSLHNNDHTPYDITKSFDFTIQ
ncbi:hypothetical protein ACFFK0_16340 [Paenibacillus chartarius]|uniref:YtkA-like domain-containing protein n=1 Tax=Paenibacillus chartarius TaxID=747481 RepID=A0ABV6DMX3_9BACL